MSTTDVTRGIGLQRDQRRERILAITRESLVERRVAELSLNEIARRVGLAKSNVLRYFGSRETILLTITEQEYRHWVMEVAEAIDGMKKANSADSAEFLADVLATTINNYPLLCELLSCTATVLEHNVTTADIVQFKLKIHEHIDHLMAIIKNLLGELDSATEVTVVIAMHGIITETWAVANPSQALVAAQQEDTRIGTTIDAVAAMRSGLALLFRGVAATCGN